jgi:hypothetical protein
MLATTSATASLVKGIDGVNAASAWCDGALYAWAGSGTKFRVLVDALRTPFGAAAPDDVSGAANKDRSASYAVAAVGFSAIAARSAALWPVSVRWCSRPYTRAPIASAPVWNAKVGSTNVSDSSPSTAAAISAATSATRAASPATAECMALQSASKKRGPSTDAASSPTAAAVSTMPPRCRVATSMHNPTWRKRWPMFRHETTVRALPVREEEDGALSPMVWALLSMGGNPLTPRPSTVAGAWSRSPRAWRMTERRRRGSCSSL